MKNVSTICSTINYLIAMILPIERETPCIWEMKMAATASYRAVPSMLIVAPIGRTNRETRGSTPFLFSRQPIVMGSVAELRIQ